MKKILFLILFFWNFSAQAESAINTDAINRIISAINHDYLYEADNSELITHGLKALQKIDNNIAIIKGNYRFYIYYNRNLSASVTYPKNNSDVSGWIKSISEILENVTRLSEKASLRDFELADIIGKKMTEKLDNNSHYYSGFEYHEEDGKNTIYTLYSDRIIDDILYLRVRIFNRQTTKEIKQSLTKYKEVKGVILDLRGNSGGMLNEALKTADLFTDNEIITYTAGRNNKNIHYYTSQEGEFYSGPLVVIIDGNTASAAEVLAAGLQEQSRAKTLGSRTFGKGTIQNILKISDESKLVLTTEQFFTPSGKIIHQQGVTPDICLNPDKEGNCPPESRSDKDEDIDTAVKILHHSL